jgi:hypothetical protein
LRSLRKLGCVWRTRNPVNLCRWLLDSGFSALLASPRHDDQCDSNFEIAQLVDVTDQILDLLRVRPKLLGELVEIRTSDLLETGIVDVVRGARW